MAFGVGVFSYWGLGPVVWGVAGYSAHVTRDAILHIRFDVEFLNTCYMYRLIAQ